MIYRNDALHLLLIHCVEIKENKSIDYLSLYKGKFISLFMFQFDLFYQIKFPLNLHH